MKLTAGFIKVFDDEHPTVIECRKAHTQQAQSIVKRGFRPEGGQMTVGIAKRLGEYLEERTRLIWDKLQQAVTSTQIEYHPELNEDLKGYLASVFNPTLKSVERYLEEMRGGFKVPTGYTVESLRTFNNVLFRINAEVDLFCATYKTSEMKKKQVTVQNISYNLNGANARVNIDSTDYSINVANSEKIFSELRKAIESSIEDTELKSKLLSQTTALQQNVGKPQYLKKYAELVALAANHMTIVGPFIPALTQLFH